MNISKFDFTKFSKEKWQEIIKKMSGDFNHLESVEIGSESINGKVVQTVELDFSYETQFDGWETYHVTFTAFEVKDKGGILESETKTWRKIMLKEFGIVYYNSLVNHIEYERECKIQQIDEEYIQELKDINSMAYVD